MRHLKLEKSIIKLDRDIEALTVAKKYLSNTDEIESIKTDLNKERQLLFVELHAEDTASTRACHEVITPMLGQELAQQEQLALLEEIKEIFGRKFPETSKESHGLNAWLKSLNVTSEWIQNDNSDWAKLIMTGIQPKKVK
ncbi:MAG: hypothetical protein ACRCW2_01135 [Cellulosilyticaceae bacterium]